MSKKIISLLMVIVLVASLMSMAITSSAMINADIVYGDVDGDGVVSTVDARLALMSAAGILVITDETAIERSDINSDGAVTLFDARQILRGVAGIVKIQPSGAFSGFTNENNIGISSPEVAIALFNTCLNRIKTEKPGFTRSESADVINFDIEEVKIGGISLGDSATSITQSIRDLIVAESEPEAAQTINKGENCDNAMSVETENYVSNLSADDVYGINVSYNGRDTIIISVALADCEIDAISQSAYADVFNTELLVGDSVNILESVFDTVNSSDIKSKIAKNAVLTMSFDTVTGNVTSYTTTYEIDMNILQANTIFSAELKGLKYSTKNTVVYDNFQW